MPAKKKIKTEPPQPQPQPLTTPLRERFLQACINFWNMYVYFCVYRFQENEDCGLATVCTILACESLTRSAALSYWFPSLNVSSMDPGAIETPEGAIDIMVMLVHLHKEGACPLPQGTTSTGDLMTDTLNSTGIMRELLFVIPFFLPFFNYTSYILFQFLMVHHSICPFLMEILVPIGSFLSSRLLTNTTFSPSDITSGLIVT